MKEKIVLFDENGEEQEFTILAYFGLDDEDYAALIPSKDLESPTYILRVEKDSDGEVVFVGIEDDEELEDAIEVFEEMNKENLQ